MQTMPQPFTRRYPTDADYTADALSLARVGWRVVSVQREPTGAIVATYAPIPTPAPAATTPLSEPSTVMRNASAVSNARHGLDLRWLISGVVVGVVLLAILACSLLSVFAAPTIGGASHVGTPAAPTAPVNLAATVLANDPTATHGPTIVSGATIGGTASDFDAAYQVMSPPGAGLVGEWTGTIAGHGVTFDVYFTKVAGSADGIPRAYLLMVSSNDGATWSATDEAAVMQTFLPFDAQHVRDVATHGNTDHIYTSQQLMNSLEPSVFQTNSGGAATPGSTDWYCDISGSGFCFASAGWE